MPSDSLNNENASIPEPCEESVVSAAIYARQSRVRDVAYSSCQSQIDMCRAFAASNDWSITQVYSDEGYSSSIAKGTIWLWYSDAVNFLTPGDICHRKVGQNRLIKLIDLLEYKKRQDRRSKDALQELADEAQELNLGY